MHDIWNPWHGCHKYSSGCKNCYMMYLDKKHGSGDGTTVFKTGSFNYPLKKDKNHEYIIKPGELIRVCMNSDFFIEEADEWRNEAFEIMRARPDVKFFILTKRIERITSCLPPDWNEGYENVMINVTIENSDAIPRLEILKNIKAKHKGVMAAPLLGELNIENYLKEGFIEQVICGGENYENPRECHYEWVKSLSDSCRKYNITFAFIETGSKFIKDGKLYNIPSKVVQSRMAYKSNLSFMGKEIHFILKDRYGDFIENPYVPRFTSVNCVECGSRLICNGCANCGRCRQVTVLTK